MLNNLKVFLLMILKRGLENVSIFKRGMILGFAGRCGERGKL
jgi:hypothetical protein